MTSIYFGKRDLLPLAVGAQTISSLIGWLAPKTKLKTMVQLQGGVMVGQRFTYTRLRPAPPFHGWRHSRPIPFEAKLVRVAQPDERAAIPVADLYHDRLPVDYALCYPRSFRQCIPLFL